MGLSPEKFWGLSWWDWCLYLMRFNKKADRDKLNREVAWAHTRALMAVIANASPNRGDKTFRPEDFIKLSFDDATVEEKKEDKDPDLFKKLKGQFGSTIKYGR